LDLIALQGDRLIIVEVKSGQEDEAFLPRQRVNPAKQRQLLKLTQAYRKEQRLLDRHVRIDVVEVVFGGKGRLQINHLEGEVTDPGWR
jgi:Holliday junction resolvase-like predicted endonuclease